MTTTMNHPPSPTSPRSGTCRRLAPDVPVVPLRDGSIQVGCDPDRAVRLADPPDGTLRLLRGLADDHDRDDLVRDCGLTGDAVDNLLGTLDRHGLLVCDPAQVGPLAGTPVVRVVTDVPLGPDLVSALRAAGVQRVQVVDPRGEDDRLALRHRLGEHAELAAGWEVVDHVDRRRLAPGTPTVLASGRLEPDPAVVEALVRNDDPHVLARPRPGAVLVGPFVVPGRTSCLACADLVRASRDDSWVEQRAVLTSLRADFPAPLVPWLVSMLVAQLACWSLGGRPDLVDRTVELRLADWRQRWRAWPAHPGCGCR